MKTFPIPHPLPPLHPFYPHKIVFSVTPVMQLKLPSCRRSFVKPIEKTRRTAPLVRQSVDNNNNDNDNDDNDNDDNDNDDKKNKKCNSGFFFPFSSQNLSHGRICPVTTPCSGFSSYFIPPLYRGFVLHDLVLCHCIFFGHLYFCYFFARVMPLCHILPNLLDDSWDWRGRKRMSCHQRFPSWGSLSVSLFSNHIPPLKKQKKTNLIYRLANRHA